MQLRVTFLEVCDLRVLPGADLTREVIDDRVKQLLGRFVMSLVRHVLITGRPVHRTAVLLS